MTDPITQRPAIACPYPGLRPFSAQEAELFFGRGAQIEELLSRLESRYFLAVVGSSGCGKSSLVRAGLVPALGEGYLSGVAGTWRIARMRPRDAPFAQLAQALLKPQALGPERDGWPGASGMLEAALRRGPAGLMEALVDSGLGEQDPLLLLVDQFEEIFRYRRDSDANEADAFVNLLLASARPAPVPVYVVLTMRSDFIGDCALFLGLPEAINDSQFLVPRLTRTQYQAAIVEPARLRGVALDESLVNRLLNDLRGDPDQLPVLQHALMRMWNRHDDHRRPLDLDDYQAVGGLEEALARHADKLLQGLDETQQAIAERLFRCLCERGEGQRDTRRPVRMTEVAAVAGVDTAAVAAVVEVFRGPGRSFLMPPAPEPLTDDTLLDISHEALIRRWRTLGRWVGREAHSAATYRRLADAALRYARDEAALWRVPDLQVALDWRAREQPSAAWAKRYDEHYTKAMAFLEASATAWEAERQARHRAEQRAARRRLFTTLGLTVLLVIALLSSFWGWISYDQAMKAAEEADKQRQEAEAQRQEAETQRMEAEAQRREAEAQRSLVLSHQLNTQAQQIQNNNGLLALLLRGEAINAVEPTLYPRLQAAEEGLRNALAQPDQLRLATLDGRVAALAYSPSTGQLASGGHDGLIRLWDPDDPGSEPQVLQGHENWVNTLAFASDGGLLASGGDDGTVRLWNLANTYAPATIAYRHDGWVWSVDFSPTTGWLASGGADGVVRVWNPKLPTLAPEQLTGHQGGVLAVAFSPRGRWLASAGADGTVRLWRLDRLQSPPRVLSGHQGWIWTLTFSPQGDELVSGDDQGTLRRWPMAASGPTTEPMIIGNHQRRVYALAFSAEGLLASADEGGELRLWDLHDPARNRVLDRQEQAIWSLSFGDGWLASGQADGAIRLWPLKHPVHEPRVLPHGPDNPVSAVAISQDWLASADQHGQIRLWSRAQPSGQSQLVGDPAGQGIYALALSADQQWLAAGVAGNRIHLWPMDDLGAAPRVFQGHGNRINALSFSPDSALLASAAADGTARLWSLSADRPATRVIQVSPSNWVNTIDLSPDGRLLATGDGENRIKLWSLDHPERPPQTLEGHDDWVTAVDFSPDGDLLASASGDGTVRLWPLGQTDGDPMVLRGPDVWMASVAFSSDGRFLAAGADRTILLWRDPDAGLLPVILRGHGNQIRQVVFSPDGRELISAADSTLRRWRVALSELVETACRRAMRNIDWEEWRWYLGALPYRLTCPEYPLPDSVVDGLLAEGDALAARGELDGAREAYRALLELGYQGKLDPQERAAKQARSRAY